MGIRDGYLMHVTGVFRRNNIPRNMLRSSQFAGSQFWLMVDIHQSTRLWLRATSGNKFRETRVYRRPDRPPEFSTRNPDHPQNVIVVPSILIFSILACYIRGQHCSPVFRTLSFLGV
ncbi:hypothetical protein KC326_g64 [Hortaea werneckii]|nr:hypothetical protein KC326_g64 [Hortaea werneckii]